MTDLSWLRQHRCETLIKRECDWCLVLSDKADIRIDCLWRLIEAGRIVITSEDHGHQFGLPAPVDASVEFTRRVGTSWVTSTALREGSLDLSLGFASGHTLEMFPISSGYEAWEIGREKQRVIAVGGGELATIGDTSGRTDVVPGR